MLPSETPYESWNSIARKLVKNEILNMAIAFAKKAKTTSFYFIVLIIVTSSIPMSIYPLIISSFVCSLAC
jgi:hypothetical protein